MFPGTKGNYKKFPVINHKLGHTRGLCCRNLNNEIQNILTASSCNLHSSDETHYQIKKKTRTFKG